jgi:hypothetical protein
MLEAGAPAARVAPLAEAQDRVDEQVSDPDSATHRCPATTTRFRFVGVRRWLTDHGIDGFGVTHEKPPAEFYIDDHGFHFTSWTDVERKLP